jgi:hypothetical protein
LPRGLVGVPGQIAARLRGAALGTPANAANAANAGGSHGGH